MEDQFDFEEFDFEETKEQREDFDFSEVEKFVKDIQPKKTTPTEAFVAGVADVPAFGFIDELTGLLGGGAEAIAERAGAFDVPKEEVAKHIVPEMKEQAEGIEVPRQDPLDIYKKYRDVQRQRMETMAEEHPREMLTGTLAGGFAIPGAALGKATKGATMAAKMAKTGIESGKLGALLGAGMTEAETLPEMAKDVATSAGVGMGLGAAMPVAGAAAKLPGKGLKAIKESDIGKIFGSYAKGDRLAEEVPQTFQKLKTLGGETVSELGERARKERTQLSKFMQQAEEGGAEIDTQQVISRVNELLEDLPDSVSKKRITKEVEEFIKEEGFTKSPTKAFELFKRVKRHMSPSGKDLGERRIFSEMDQAFKEELEKGVKTLPESYTKMSQLLGQMETLTGKPPAKFQTTKEKLATREKLANLLTEASPEVKHKTKLKDILEGFADPLKKGKQVKGLRDIAPDLAKRIEDEAPDLAEKIRLGMSIDPKELQTISPDVRAQLLAQIGGGLSFVRKGAAAAGTGVKSTADFMKDIGSQLSDASPEAIKDMAQKLYTSSDKIAQNLGRVLEKMIEQDKRQRQATLFGIMQNPAYRELLKGDTEVNDE